MTLHDVVDSIDALSNSDWTPQAHEKTGSTLDYTVPGIAWPYRPRGHHLGGQY